MAGRVFASARTRGMPCGAGLGIMTYASVPKSTTIKPPQQEPWEAASNATCGNARDQPPSQRHAACNLHSIVRSREGDDELSRPERPVASQPPSLHGLRSQLRPIEKPTMTPVVSCLWMTPRREPLFWNLPPRVHAHPLHKCVLTMVHPLEEKGAYWPASRRALAASEVPPRSLWAPVARGRMEYKGCVRSGRTTHRCALGASRSPPPDWTLRQGQRSFGCARPMNLAAARGNPCQCWGESCRGKAMQQNTAEVPRLRETMLRPPVRQCCGQRAAHAKRCR